MTKVPNDAPAWLVEVAGPHWGTTAWDAWESYRAKLTRPRRSGELTSSRSVLGRPTEISAHIPSCSPPWVSVPIDWQRFGDRDALLHAFGELVTEVAKTTT